MKVENRESNSNNTKYKLIESTIGDYIVDEEIGAVYVVEANINHLYEKEIELSVEHNEEMIQVFGIMNTISINQFKEELINLGGVL